MVGYDMAWYGMMVIWYGMVWWWYDIVWYGMGWHLVLYGISRWV